jgi:hypothetical protein
MASNSAAVIVPAVQHARALHIRGAETTTIASNCPSPGFEQQRHIADHDIAAAPR